MAEWTPWDILEDVDESDLRDVTRARVEKEVAEEVAKTKRAAFNALIKRIYTAPRRQGDLEQLAEAAGLSTAQVKRLAAGESSGNRKRPKSEP